MSTPTPTPPRWSRMRNAHGAWVPGVLSWRSGMVFDARALGHRCPHDPRLPVVPRWVKPDWRRGPWASLSPGPEGRLVCAHHRTQAEAKAFVVERYREDDLRFLGRAQRARGEAASPRADVLKPRGRPTEQELDRAATLANPLEHLIELYPGVVGDPEADLLEDLTLVTSDAQGSARASGLRLQRLLEKHAEWTQLLDYAFGEGDAA